MKPRVCPHCREPFQPEIHNAWHQRYCTRAECQRARNRASCRRWRLRNPGHFKDYDQRVRDWRRGHPRYWRHERRRVLTADILVPVYRHGRMAMRFHDRSGVTLQHVVMGKPRGWRAVCRGMGITLQNVVHGLRVWTYRFRHEGEERDAADIAGERQPAA